MGSLDYQISYLLFVFLQELSLSLGFGVGSDSLRQVFEGGRALGPAGFCRWLTATSVASFTGDPWVSGLLCVAWLGPLVRGRTLAVMHSGVPLCVALVEFCFWSCLGLVGRWSP